MVTGTLPNGFMLKPLTVFGMMLDIRMLSKWCPILLKTSGPAADMSAPESGNSSMGYVPVVEDMSTVMVGAGFVMASCIVYNCNWC